MTSLRLGSRVSSHEKRATTNTAVNFDKIGVDIMRHATVEVHHFFLRLFT